MRHGLEEQINLLLDNGKEVFLVYPIPESSYDIPSALARLAKSGGGGGAKGYDLAKPHSRSGVVTRREYLTPFPTRPTCIASDLPNSFATKAVA